ncbi:conserved hypothetical protein [Burkholderiales bacterium 8X]|nr:conserved hypothetical protein [Burkholderiales bacterium 8X]
MAKRILPPSSGAATLPIRAITNEAAERVAVRIQKKRLFRAGDLVLLRTPTDWLRANRLYVVYMGAGSSFAAEVGIRQTDPDPEHQSCIQGGGIVASFVPQAYLQLVAAVDASDEGPSRNSLINFIIGRGLSEDQGGEL